MTDKKCDDCTFFEPFNEDCQGDGCYWCENPQKEECPCANCNSTNKNNFELKESKQIRVVTPNLGAVRVR